MPVKAPFCSESLYFYEWHSIGTAYWERWWLLGIQHIHTPLVNCAFRKPCGSDLGTAISRAWGARILFADLRVHFWSSVLSYPKSKWFLITIHVVYPNSQHPTSGFSSLAHHVFEIKITLYFKSKEELATKSELERKRRPSRLRTKQRKWEIGSSSHRLMPF